MKLQGSNLRHYLRAKKLDRTIAQEISRWFIAIEASVQSQGSPCGICSRRSGSKTRFPPNWRPQYQAGNLRNRPDLTCSSLIHSGKPSNNIPTL
jgi:hypothetical protein